MHHKIGSGGGHVLRRALVSLNLRREVEGNGQYGFQLAAQMRFGKCRTGIVSVRNLHDSVTLLNSLWFHFL